VKLYDAFRRVNATKRTEESVLLRVTVLGTVVIAVLGTLVSGAAPVVDGIAALILLPVGAWLSYVRRGRDNTLLKLLLTVGAALALQRFFGDVRGAITIEDTRAPLASLFLAVQVLHGFDLPARRDLGFTIASSLTLIALAGTNTHAGLFGALLLVYVVLTAVSLIEMQHSAASERADRLREREELTELRDTSASGGVPGAGAPVPTRRSISGWLAAGGAATLKAIGAALLAGVLVFGLLPRGSSNQLGGLPFKGFPSLSLPNARISNPGIQAGGQVDSEAAQQSNGPTVGFNPTAYFGFAEYVDLRTGGRLSDDPIMRVRADRPRFWRGIVFDTYDGKGWTRSQVETPRPTFGQPVRLQTERLPGGEYVDVTQTFELLDDTPNLLFAAGDPRTVYLAGGSVNRWDDGTVTTGQLQEVGTIYSVVSRYDASPPEELRAATGPVPDDVRARFTQLPDGLPQRVRDLATRLTAGAGTNYARAEAIGAWLGANTEYTLDVLPPRDAPDLVDHFLFESRQGWCEPIAASMAVMLRSVGVPARFATGFQPGERNPISGLWDVKISDAHAWVEVYVPAHGWIAFDPTGAVPQAVNTQAGPQLPIVELFRWVGDGLVGLVPAPVRTALRNAASRLADTPAVAAALAALLAGTGLAVWWRRRGQHALAVPSTPFERLEAMLAVRGVQRDDWQTPREYVRRVRLHCPDVPEGALATLLQAEERRRYGGGAGEPVSEVETGAVEHIAAHLARTDDEHARRVPAGSR